MGCHWRALPAVRLRPRSLSPPQPRRAGSSRFRGSTKVRRMRSFLTTTISRNPFEGFISCGAAREDGMPMRALAEAVAKALQVHGFTVTMEAPLEGRTGQVHTVAVLAEGTKAIIVDVSSSEVVEPEEVAVLVQRVEDTGADLAVLCHLGPRSADALAATSDRVVLWGQDRVIRILGEATVAAAVGGTPNPLPLDASREDVLPPEPDPR